LNITSFDFISTIALNSAISSIGIRDGLVSVLEGPKAKETYDWEVTDFEAPLAKDLVIYELLVRDFHSKKTLQAVIDSLDYLKKLGINAIELMPVTEFDGNDSWGYNPNHFFAYDKAYGNRNLYKKFIDECHKNGIAVIIDMVFNHATGICPMAKLYWDGDATANNNPWFNRVAKHPFNVFHDINHEYEGTRKYFKRVLQYWVEEYKVDGYRMDLTKGFTQVNYGPSGNWDVYDASRIVILKDYCDAAKSINPDTYFIIEHLGGEKEETELVNYGILPWRNKNNAYCQAAMGWPSDSNFADSNDLNKIKTNQPNSLGGMFTDSWVGYAESHDEERNMYKAVAYGDGNLKKEDAHAERMSRVPAVIAFSTLIPGPKMMWQFQELGYDYSINTCENGKIKDECRTYAKPIPWTLQWDKDPDRWAAYEKCAKIISLRTKNPELFRTETFTATNLYGGNWDKPRRMDISYKDSTDSKKDIDIIVLANFSATANISTNIDVPFIGTWINYLTGEKINIKRTDKVITLKPGELLILMSREIDNLVSIDETLADGNSCIVLPTIAEDNITVISAETPSSIEVINLSGNVVAKEFNTDNISVANLSKGHYIVRVLVDNNISTHRIIKK
jgi:1,4-alpha-glucan branching enzyme